MLETTKNKLCLNSCFSKNSHQFSINDDVIVPDSKPDVNSILFVDCVPTIEDESVNSGQISISGTCDINILYSSDTEIQKIIRISTVIPFKTSFEIPGITSDSNITVNILPIDIASSILNSRKISLNISLNAIVTSSNKNEVEYIETINNSECAQMLYKSATLPELIDYTKVKTNIRDTAMLPMSLPNIDDIVSYSTNILNEENVISDDKVIFKGDLYIKICYTSTNDNKISTFETTLPFSGFANLKNLTLSSKITSKSRINSLSLKILPDSDDLMRIIEFDASISTNVMAENNKAVSLISDMYCTTHVANPKIEKFSYNTCSSSMPEDISLRGVINIPETESISVISSFGRIKELTLAEKDNKSLLTGTIELNIIYELPSSGNINSVSIDMPMEHLLNSNLNNILNITINAIEVSQAEIGKFDIKLSLKVSGECITNEEIELLTDVAETEERIEKPASLTVYFTKPDDSFWKIAKKYNTTIDAICKMNNLSENDRLNNGQIIIV